MPHATSIPDDQEELDDALILRALDPENPLDLSRDLEPGEKADDAVDFGDLSDDDLAEDEDEEDDGGVVHPSEDYGSRVADHQMQDTGSDEQEYSDNASGNALDDLFGERSSSPVEGFETGNTIQSTAPDGDITSFESNATSVSANDHQPASFASLSQINEGRHDAQQDIYKLSRAGQEEGGLSKEQQLQLKLLAMSGSGLGVTGAPRDQEDQLARLWPSFQRNATPKFMDLLPPPKARYIGKTPLRRPKPVQPTRLNLDIAMDQEKSFRLPTGSNKRFQEENERPGVITIERETTDGEHEEESEGPESDFENEPVGGVSWQDLQIVCEDWDIPDLTDDSSPELVKLAHSEQKHTLADLGDDYDNHLERRPAKRRKLGREPSEILKAPVFALPSLRDPEHATARIAKKPTLDLNDANLLIDYQVKDLASKSAKNGNFRERDRGAFAKKMNRRYNISNDEAYDLLKENHQSKVRSTLGSQEVEHSMPAKKLQWPFYRTKMHKSQARSFHRPLMQFIQNENVVFDRTRVVKRKNTKGKDIKSIYATAKDLSLGDNSSMLLLEYSEEHPMMLSKFGMGNRLTNYYRRKNMEDTSRPKGAIGETSVLLPQDKSPFSLFGHVDPGETTPTLHNAMYRAPVFDQSAKPTDFLVIRNRNGEDGHTYHLRNIENLHVVGQEFPSVDIPGPHSRKVTNAAKARLKMVSFRLLRKGKQKKGQLSVTEVTPHIEGSTDVQNRQKLKDILDFSKEEKIWKMKKDHILPEEEIIRDMVKPEDVCLIESMEVGQQHLQDSGFVGRGNDEDDDDETKEGQDIERQLAPWNTSRNFTNASSGKAMLRLHGEGDPTGRGEAFSFIKTSMKGGFKAMGESVEDKLDAKKLKELGGHSYNVARQQKSYEESIRRIWEAQKHSLSSRMEESDTDMDEEYAAATEEHPEEAKTPRSEIQTPSGMRRADDDAASQFSKMSTNSQTGKVLRITREVRIHGVVSTEYDVIRDAAVIHHYLKRARTKNIDPEKLEQVEPTGNADLDRERKKAIDDELLRLQRNKERRMAREKQKGLSTDGAADSPTSPDDVKAPVRAPKPAGTARKCANCGIVGHIKTNKKLCPMLNGTQKQEDGFGSSAFAAGGSI